MTTAIRVRIVRFQLLAKFTVDFIVYVKEGCEMDYSY